MGVHVIDWRQEGEVNYKPRLGSRLKRARGREGGRRTKRGRMWV